MIRLPHVLLLRLNSRAWKQMMCESHWSAITFSLSQANACPKHLLISPRLSAFLWERSSTESFFVHWMFHPVQWWVVWNHRFFIASDPIRSDEHNIGGNEWWHAACIMASFPSWRHNSFPAVIVLPRRSIVFYLLCFCTTLTAPTLWFVCYAQNL